MLGLILGLGTNVAATSGGGGSGTVWSAATDYTLTNGNLTAERTANTNAGYRIIFGSAAKSVGTAIYTVNAIGTNNLYLGLGVTSETTFPGDTTSSGMGYRNDGTIWAGGGLKTTAASYTAGDAIKVVLSATDMKFYKNNVLQWTETFAFGALNPAMSSFNATGNKVTSDFSGW